MYAKQISNAILACYGKDWHMCHMLLYKKLNELVAERKLPKVQTKIDCLHFYIIYDGLPDPGQLPLIPVSKYLLTNLLIPCYQYVLSLEFWSTRPKFLMEKLAP